MSRGKRGADARAVTRVPVIQRHDDILEPIYEADPDGRPVVHHRVVDTIGRMLRAGNITREMHDAARDFAATFTIARFDAVVCMSLDRLPGSSNHADLTDAQVDARRRVGDAIDALGGLGSPAGGCVWHVVGMQRSIREWSMRQGWGGKPIGERQAHGIWSQRWGCWRVTTATAQGNWQTHDPERCERGRVYPRVPTRKADTAGGCD